MTENSSIRCHSCGSCCSSFFMLLGRICLSIIFILAGVGKLLDPATTAAYMTAKGIGMANILLYGAAALEILAGFFLLIGFKTRWASFLLLLFLIPTTYFFHNFWNAPPELAQIEMINFLKNLAIFGGLLYTLSVGPGKISFDELFCGHCNKS